MNVKNTHIKCKISLYIAQNGQVTIELHQWSQHLTCLD